MTSNSDRYLLSNGTDDRVTLFHDGRVKVWSRFHLWEIIESGRHNALGEFVRLAAGRILQVQGPSGARQKPTFVASIDPTLGDRDAATVAGDNGTFVTFHHDGSITVGNDCRDIEETVNLGREGLAGSESGRGGSVMVFFAGSYRPKTPRRCDHEVQIPEIRPQPRRRYPDEYEIREGKIGPR
ncbi:hypothetical protein [Nocardia mexicana]|uniref:Uncharacterized protein n=1 Tax=Nocardia mexicana TaxID=279262 RepID=A0A370GIW4_9NOCA|nr:hypothetical protein [Nocardia mexicana]RDI43310.1 hypothetical protein DFR68_12273 [Nocardia mexicana]